MNKARIGVIGAGWWATEYHIPNLKKREDVELVSGCKLEEDQLNLLDEPEEKTKESTSLDNQENILMDGNMLMLLCPL